MIGILLALIEVSLFTIPIMICRQYNIHFKSLGIIDYFWICFTVLTALWELNFIINYQHVYFESMSLLKNKTHVWTNDYNLSYLFPWNFSKIFYAEYAAYADKYYMARKGIWSRIIESTHALFCGLFAFLYLINLSKKTSSYKIALGVAMGSQLMNSLLYMGEYFIQTTDQSSLNFNTDAFPTGFALIKRPFMYVNIFWTIMPLYIIIKNLT
tara:strand:+ start:356 stop:991 length:636 start_codon:yes stop_codon:yes gene_type:complete